MPLARRVLLNQGRYKTIGGAVVLPLLSSPSGAATSDITADLSVTTDTANGTLYVVVTTSVTTPSKEQVKAGTDHNDAAAAFAGNASISSSGSKTIYAAGLTGGTTYYSYFMHEDSGGKQSAVSAASSFATAAAETTIVLLAADGTTTGLSGTASNLNASVADRDGGNNAASWIDQNPATNGQCVINTSAITFNNGVNKFRFRVKTLQSDATKMWLRVRPQNTTVTSACHFNITNDATLDANRVGTSGWGSASVTSQGNGWFRISGELDMAGVDVAGLFSLFMGDADNDQTINRNGNNEVAVHDLRISH